MPEEVSRLDILVSIERLSGQVALIAQRVDQAMTVIEDERDRAEAMQGEVAALKAKLFDVLLEGAEKKGFFRGVGFGAKAVLIMIGALGGATISQVAERAWSAIWGQ